MIAVRGILCVRIRPLVGIPRTVTGNDCQRWYSLGSRGTNVAIWCCGRVAARLVLRRTSFAGRRRRYWSLVLAALTLRWRCRGLGVRLGVGRGRWSLCRGWSFLYVHLFHADVVVARVVRRDTKHLHTQTVSDLKIYIGTLLTFFWTPNFVRIVFISSASRLPVCASGTSAMSRTIEVRSPFLTKNAHRPKNARWLGDVQQSSA